ncbi:MAG TPA: bifunctional methylenetetrahydrofolate dehydrogenase/methenyltetrahydrofolate cyclohydrolase FolD [Candidatus Thermoplasmatota archaeon]|nr:bifunctional methylenetetrahydrofolate dehydrogenase/methenyltetrahydrofolate cyclohydrolase FolD [Candidatus Thermoplasmatota archaeon]
MGARILDGKALAATMRAEIRKDVETLRAQGVVPNLQFVLVGDNAASVVYVENKNKACAEVGIEHGTRRLPAATTEAELLAVLRALNADPAVHGILVQLPLPPQISEEAVLATLDPRKDVDGFTHENLGRLLAGRPGFVPCTPAGVVELLERNGHSPQGKRVAVLGRGNIVGKPLSVLLLGKGRGGDATVTVCHSRTPNLEQATREADVLVAAMGQPEFVRARHVKPGAVVVDVGINRVADPSHPKGSRIVGDVAFEEVSKVASAITPVPGGVGPMTIAMLLANTVRAARGLSR